MEGGGGLEGGVEVDSHTKFVMLLLEQLGKALAQLFFDTNLVTLQLMTLS